MGTSHCWNPTKETVYSSNLWALMQERGFQTYEQAHAWSVSDPTAFWTATLRRLGVKFRHPYASLVDAKDTTHARWLVGAQLNIAESCFLGDGQRLAIVTHRQSGRVEYVTADELDRMSNRVANGLKQMGLHKGAAVAIIMSMTMEAVAIYLGIVKAGCVVVSIPDSLPTEEIATRLHIGAAAAVFTQDQVSRGGKFLPMYGKVCEARAPQTVVVSYSVPASPEIRDDDIRWEGFLPSNDIFEAVVCSPHDPLNILFSSGTTGDPKAVPWDHTTPIKCASDALYHQDIKRDDVVCWPTNLGWMMGPWLIFASLLNNATIALYEGMPVERSFCEFVQNAKVTMLGLVPSIVKGWRHANCAENLDWSAVRAFSSSGEASNPQDYEWLMQLNQPEGVRKPIIEYCGGTEVGGGYIANNVLQGQNPGEFNGKAMGSDFVVLNDTGRACVADEAGEVFLIPPSMGLSSRLVNKSNDAVYYEGCPKWKGTALRRHGDRFIVRAGNRYLSDGRADDTMNLSGIKIGSGEIERVLSGLPGVRETAAVGVPPREGGPEKLVIFAVTDSGANCDVASLKAQAQAAIKSLLNPLFHVHEVCPIESLPRTASNKVMHRQLRSQYLARGL